MNDNFERNKLLSIFVIAVLTIVTVLTVSFYLQRQKFAKPKIDYSSLNDLKTYSNDKFSVQIPTFFKQRNTNLFSDPTWLFYGSTDSHENENRIYIETGGPFDFKSMENSEQCLEFSKEFTQDNPPYWATNLIEYRFEKSTSEFNKCYFKYITKRKKYNLIYEHIVFLPSEKRVDSKEFNVFMYYFEGTDDREIEAMKKSIQNFKLK